MKRAKKQPAGASATRTKAKTAGRRRALSWEDCAAIGARGFAYLIASIVAVGCVALACAANMDWSADGDQVLRAVQFASIIGGALFFALSAQGSTNPAGRAGFAALALVCVGFNIWCAYQNGAHRNAQTRDNLRGEISAAQRYDSERAELVAKRDRAAITSGRETTDALEAQIAAAKSNFVWRRSRECSDVTLPDSKALCDGFRGLQGRLAAAREYERSSFEIRAMDAEWAGKAAPASAAPEIDGLAVFFNLSEQDKTLLAVILKDWWPAIMVEIFAAIGPFSVFRLAGSLLAAPSAPQRRQSEVLPLATTSAPAPDTQAAPVEVGPVARFVTDALEPARGGRVEPGALYEHFRKWCAIHGVEPVNNNRFGREAGALIKRDTTKRRQYLGFALRPLPPIALHVVSDNGTVDAKLAHSVMRVLPIVARQNAAARAAALH